MNREHSIENTKKYAILEVMFFNEYSVGMQSFVLLSLAIYFNMSSFLYQLYHLCQLQDICCKYLLSG